MPPSPSASVLPIHPDPFGFSRKPHAALASSGTHLGSKHQRIRIHADQDDSEYSDGTLRTESSTLYGTRSRGIETRSGMLTRDEDICRGMIWAC